MEDLKTEYVSEQSHDIEVHAGNCVFKVSREFGYLMEILAHFWDYDHLNTEPLGFSCF